MTQTRIEENQAIHCKTYKMALPHADQASIRGNLTCDRLGTGWFHGLFE
jgi:hypothetical protein